MIQGILREVSIDEAKKNKITIETSVFEEQICRHTRSSSNLDFIVPRVKTCESGSFFYHGIKNWNELPRHVKECKGKDSFKENVKKHLMEKGLKKHNCEFHFY